MCSSTGDPKTSASAILLVLIFSLSLQIPFASSGSSLDQSGLGLSGFLPGIDQSDDSLSVAYSLDGEYLAAGFRTGVAIYLVESGEVVKQIPTNDRVEEVKFSKDSNWLIAGMKSFQATQPSIIVISKEDNWTITDSATGGRDVNAIAISDDNSLVALRDTSTGITEYSNPGFGNSVKYDNVHTASVTCISYNSDASFILSGDEDGRIVKWIQGSSQIEDEWFFSSAVADCAFDPIENRFAALSSSGELRIYSNSGGLLLTEQLNSATTIQWADDGSRFFVLQDIGAPRIISYATGSWDIVDSTSIGHAALDFSMHSSNEMLAIASDSTNVVLYSSDYIPEGFGLSGTDTDRDGIPNDIDLDDDGDGIPDVYDRGDECPNSDCSLDANLELIRQINIEIINRQLVIRDTVLYSSEISSAIRKITAEAIDGTAETITEPEVDRVAQALCDNIRQEDVFYAWDSIVAIEGTDMSNPSFACYATSGLFGVSKYDEITRLSMTWITTFNLSHTPTLPYNISFSEIIPHIAGSAAQIAPLSPINLEVSMEGAISSEVPTWTSDSGRLELFIEAKPLAEPTATDNILSFAFANIIWIVLVIIALALAFVGIIRKRNSFDLSLTDEDEEPSSYQPSDDDYDEDEEWTDDSEDQDYTEETQEWDDSVGGDAWTADSGIAPPAPRKGPPSKRQRLGETSKQLSFQDEKPQRRRRSEGPKPAGRTRGSLADVAATQSNDTDVPTEWDYGWDGAYDDSQEEFGYEPLLKELPVKVRKVKLESNEPTSKTNTKSARKVKVKENNEDTSTAPTTPKVAKKRKKVSRKKVSKKKTASKSGVNKSTQKTKTGKENNSKTAKKDEEAMMSSALSKLINTDE